MYLFFLKITLFTYFFIFVIKSLVYNIFTNILYLRICSAIEQQCKAHVEQVPCDEWINPDRIYTVRIDTDNGSEPATSTELEETEEDHDINLSIVQRMINAVFEENTTSFSILSRTVLLLMATKYFIGNGLSLEYFVGLSIGSLVHVAHLFYNMGDHMKKWYFGNREGLNVHDVVIQKDKLPPNLFYLFPIVPIIVLNVLKNNVYSRVLGEWIFDLNIFYLFVSQISGYLVIQNMLRIVDYSRNSASVLIIAILYCVLILLF